jgi:parvulin-like peptidyl-prolyl isomerase
MNRLILMAVFVFACFTAVAQEIPAPAITQSVTPVVLSAPERVYSATEYESVQKESAQARNDFNALLAIYQQQRAERELILSAILQAATGGDLEKVRELVRQIIVNQLQPRTQQ